MRDDLNREAVDAIIQRYAPDDGFFADYQSLLVMEGRNWYLDWYPTMANMDERIPGVGLHAICWTKARRPNGIPNGGAYPHAYRNWDTVIRGLKYFALGFWHPCPSQRTASMMENTIESVEECLRQVVAALHRPIPSHRPMGYLANALKPVLGDDLYDAVMELNRWLRVAKHINETPIDRRLRANRIELHEATGLYYASRLVGSQALSHVEGLTDDYIDCATEAAYDGQFIQVFYGPHRTSISEWSIIDPYPEYEDGQCTGEGEYDTGVWGMNI